MSYFLLAVIAVLNFLGLYRQYQQKQIHLNEHTEFYEDDCWWCQKDVVADGIGRRKHSWRGWCRWLRREMQLRRGGYVEFKIRRTL